MTEEKEEHEFSVNAITKKHYFLEEEINYLLPEVSSKLSTISQHHNKFQQIQHSFLCLRIRHTQKGHAKIC